ncbi:MAG: SprT-like domain-containing protein [Flavobacteriales bacterium]|nr:SprT-like domain-containing protein [Flavobacteriales bacterium]
MNSEKLRKIEEGLRPFVPSGVSANLAELIVKHRCHVTITRDRSSKLGDYRHPTPTSGHRVSVNGSLNPYAFVITFIHEMAHLTAYEKFKNKVDPHGKEWKQEFHTLMQPYLRPEVFPEPLLSVLASHMRNPKSSTVRDAALMREIRVFDAQSPTVLLEELPLDARFFLRSREFVKGDRLRKRFRCEECASGRKFLISPIAEVVPVASQ